MSRTTFLFVVLLTLVACAKRMEPLPGDTVTADGGVRLSAPRAGSRAEPIGAIESKLYPPDLIMERQGELALTAAQRAAIVKEADVGQSEIHKLKWDLEAEKEKLVKMLDAEKVDEAKTNEAAAALMKKENEIKSAHLGMLVRVKNLLTPEQQKKLRAAREAERCEAPRP
jgi:hypothetical protein